MYYKGDKTLEEVAQRDCGVFILGHVQKSAGYRPGQCAMADTGWTGFLGL